MPAIQPADALGPAMYDSPWRSISTSPSLRPRYLRRDRGRQLDDERRLLRTVVHCLSDADVAILSRAGSDLSQRRFNGEAPRYTHSGFVVRQGSQWIADHLLNRHGGERGLLARHPLIDFFRDDPYAYRIGVMIPGRALQNRIRAVLQSPVRQRLHTPEYSRLSYPFSTQYQNSNQWLAEIIGAAQSGLEQRAAIQDYLRRQGLKPTVLHLNPLLQVAARCITDNTRLDDHPWPARLRGQLSFLIEPSLRHYLQHSDPECRVVHLALPQPSSLPGTAHSDPASEDCLPPDTLQTASGMPA